MKLLLRQTVRLGILLLVVRVLVDMATPHSPGAFRLDPSTSVEVARASHPASAAAVLAQPSRTQGRAVTGPIAQQSAELRSARPARAFFPRIIHLSESTGSPPASDDD
jgi:hypothetical protein